MIASRAVHHEDTKKGTKSTKKAMSDATLPVQSRSFVILLRVLRAFLCAFVVSLSTPSHAQAPTVRRVVEPNGLRLMVKANPSSDIVALHCLVRVGVVEEADEPAGIAALLAESCLRGTRGQQGPLWERAIGAAGGGVAVVSQVDYSEFSLTTSRDRFPAAIKLMAEMVGEPALTEEALKESRAALLRRQEAVEDDFDAASYQTLLGELYRKGPYGRSLFGYPSTIEEVTLQELRRFHQRHYIPANVIVAVVGAVDPAQAAEAARKAFAGMEMRPRPAIAAPAAEVISQARVQLVRKAGENAQIMVGYPVPRTSAQNYPVYRVLNAILGEGKRSRLFQELREKQQHGYALGSFYQPLLHQSHIVGFLLTQPFQRNPRTGAPEPTVDAARTRLLETISTLAESGPTDAEVARARNLVIGRHALEQERNGGQAHWLAWSEMLRLGFLNDQEFASRISGVTKEQVQQAAKDTFKQYALVVTLPKEE
jgi:predicted Zn-dependent peptidase